MADYLLLQNGTDRLQLQDASGNLLLQISGVAAPTIRRMLLLGVGSLLLVMIGLV